MSIKRVSSGKYVDLAELTYDDVDIEDINRSLNQIKRFTGHWKDREPLTVAQHTRLVLIMARRLYPKQLDVHLDCLLHDAGEAYYGDIATPLKKLFGEQYKDYADSIDDVIYSKYYNPLMRKLSENVYRARKTCDTVSLDIERRVMWKNQRGKDNWPPALDFLTLREKNRLFDEVCNEPFDIVQEYEQLVEEINDQR